MESSYSVKTHVFEGPLDTLLSLIEKRRLFINDISLAQVADDYIAYVKELETAASGSGQYLSDLAHFILIASTLVLIKSKSLLPSLTLSEEEEHSIEDLEKRLSEYQKYKTLTIHLRKMFGIHTQYLRLPDKEKIVVFTPDKDTSPSRLHEAVKSVILSIPKKDIVPKAVVEKVISLEEMISSLTDRIQSSFKMSFRDFAKAKDSKTGRETKVHLIVSFLAMLELVKQGIIYVRQEADFQDIEMESQQVGTPRY